MKKKLLTLGIVLALVAVLVTPMAALATNEGEQGASTSSATSILIQNQDSTATVAVITFPAGVPGATVSDPFNDQAETQVFGAATVAQPVVTLSNLAGVSYILWFNISTFTEGVVFTESYVILTEEAECLSEAAIDQAVTFDANTTTGTTIAATTNMDLYLKVVLSSLAGKTGTSTITILGESP